MSSALLRLLVFLAFIAVASTPFIYLKDCIPKNWICGIANYHNYLLPDYVWYVYLVYEKLVQLIEFLQSLGFRIICTNCGLKVVTCIGFNILKAVVRMLIALFRFLRGGFRR